MLLVCNGELRRICDVSSYNMLTAFIFSQQDHKFSRQLTLLDTSEDSVSI